MRISKEEAHGSANAAKKLHTVKKRQAWLFCPYMPGAAYHTVHFDRSDNQSYQCEGENCRYCPSQPNRKVHIPCLLYKRPKLIEHVPTLAYPQDIRFEPSWVPKIIELTGNCFKALDEPSQPDQLAVAWRPGDRQNGPLHFRWVVGRLLDVPDDLADLDVNRILPGIIGGTYRTNAELALDNSEAGRIKHKTPYQSLPGENGENA